jgi:hypothetical protein
VIVPADLPPEILGAPIVATTPGSTTEAIADATFTGSSPATSRSGRPSTPRSARDLTRADLRRTSRLGLERTKGNLPAPAVVQQANRITSDFSTSCGSISVSCRSSRSM